MKNFKTFDLKSLVIADENARKDSPPDSDIEMLAQLIAAEGLQTPLNGYRRGKTQLAIYDGRRRLFALRALAKQGRLPADCAAGIPCRIDTKEIARQASLSADMGHRGFHPTEAYRQFSKLIDDGQTIPEIAKTYSVSEREVSGALKLARLAPTIFEAFAANELTVEQARAFTIVDDHDRQLQVYEGGGRSHNAHWIRSRLTQGEIPSTDKRALLIGVEAYEQAGGIVRRDLFDEDNVTFVDEALLDTLVTGRLEAARVELAKEGWAQTCAMLNFDHDIYRSHLRVHPSQEPLGEDAQKEYDAAEARLSALAEIEDQLDEDGWEEVDALEARMEALQEAHAQYQPEDYSIGLAVVSLGRQGELEIVRGLVERKAAPKTQTDKPAMPHSAHRLLMEIATQCLARDLANNQDIADIVLTASLAHSVFGFSAISAVKISVSGASIGQDGELPVDHDLTSRQEVHAEQLGRDLETAIDYVATLDAAARAELRALAVAVSIDLTEPRGDQRNSRARHVGAKLAAMLASEPTNHWTPDEAFFKKLPKPALLDALAEMGRQDTGLAKAKKGDLVPMAARLAKQTRWIPEPLYVIRAATPETQTVAA